MNHSCFPEYFSVSLPARVAAAALGLSVLVAAPGALARGDVEAGKLKAAPCAACHGDDGNSPNPIWPRLAGQWPDYIVRALEAYASGERKNAIMVGFAAPLSEQDREDLGAYFAAQEPTVFTVAR